jgi:hypothetical protein
MSERTPVEDAYIEVFAPDGATIVALEGDQVALGSAAGNDVAVTWDDTVSKLHAVFVRYVAGWCIRDVGSRNGTFLNGERIVTEHVLRPGDQLVAGRTRILFRLRSALGEAKPTAAAQGPPELTRRERDVLLALCRPVLKWNLFTEPAPIKAIASELVISESAVKKHLGRLYDKFEIHDPNERRRGRLAAEAIGRGAVGLSDVAG